jgi:hypothetical protein
VADHRFDGGTPSEFAFDEAEDAALLTRDEDAVRVLRVMPAISLVDIGALSRCSCIGIFGLATPVWCGRLFRQSQPGDGLMKRNVFALFGAVTVLLTTMTALTLSRATPFASGVGGLKCYDVKGGIEKCSVVDQPPFIVRTSVRHTRLD